ncbi:hypothetical protein BJ166DRAFT_130166 [Pestalotiopsis sp. NC0098]|nr:hypothetical protein BJ166DRAFT_130166 [Pestalotiopsis sp. NC0098]
MLRNPVCIRRACSWSCCFWSFFYVLVSLRNNASEEPSLAMTHLYTIVVSFYGQNEELAQQGKGKGVGFVWFLRILALRNFHQIHGNGKGHTAFRREGRSCCLVCVFGGTRNGVAHLRAQYLQKGEFLSLRFYVKVYCVFAHRNAGACFFTGNGKIWMRKEK